MKNPVGLSRVVLFLVLCLSAFPSYRTFGKDLSPQPAVPEISEALQPFVDSHGLAGIVAVVATQDGIVSKNVLGYADIAAGRKMNGNEMFWIASMTKAVTGTAVMMLIDEGKISLDDPVTKYIPEFKDLRVVAEKDDAHILLKPVTETMTVRHLLCHTSGLTFLSELQRKFGIESVPLDHSALASVTGPLEFQPGSAYLYSNQGINMGGRIVEVASGMPFAEFLQKRIFDPLGMKDTTFWLNEEQMLRLAKPYRINKEKNGMDEFPIGYFKRPYTDRVYRFAEPGGGLFSTADDMVRFCRMHVDGTFEGKRYLSEKAIQTLHQDQTGPLNKRCSVGWYCGPEHISRGGALATQMSVGSDGSIFVYMIQSSGEAAGKSHGAFIKAGRGILDKIKKTE